MRDTPYDTLDAIALGLPLPAPVQYTADLAAKPAAPGAYEQALQYALAKQVPDMARGFTIATAYGDITIPPGWMAERIQCHVERVLQVELMATPEGAA